MRASLASATSLFALLLLESNHASGTPATVTATQPASFGYVLVGPGGTAGSTSSLVTETNKAANSYLTVQASTGQVVGAGLHSSTATSATVSYTFSPSASGAFSQNIVATDTTTGSNSVTLSLTGTGVAPVASATSSISAGYVLVGAGQTGTASFTVNNTGNAYLALSTAARSINNTAYNLNGSISGATSASVFVGTAASISLVDGSATVTGKTSSASYNYTFTPTVTGSVTASVVTTFTNGISTANTAGSLTTTLTGTGVAPLLGSVTNSGVVYGRIGTTTTGSLAVSNIGNGNLAGTGTLYNLNGSVSAVSSGGFGLGSSSISLASNATATVGSTATSTLGYTYIPTIVSGSTTATVAIAFSNGAANTNAAAGTISTVLTGSVVGPTYASSFTSVSGGSLTNDTPTAKGALGATVAATSTIAFGNVQGGASKTVYLELQNTASASLAAAALTDLTIDKFSITGTNASAFSISSIGGSVITEGGYLLVPIQVSTIGTAIGALNSTLTIFTDESVALGGTGDTFTYSLTAYNVPEPASLAVLGVGLAGLASFRRRRNSAA